MQANMNCSSVVTIMMLPMVRMATKTHCTTCWGGGTRGQRDGGVGDTGVSPQCFPVPPSASQSLPVPYLQPLGAVDGSQGPQHAQHPQDLHHRDGAGAAGGHQCPLGALPVLPVSLPVSPQCSLDAERDEGDADHQQVQEVEPVAAEGALVQEGAESGHLR